MTLRVLYFGGQHCKKRMKNLKKNRFLRRRTCQTWMQ